MPRRRMEWSRTPTSQNWSRWKRLRHFRWTSRSLWWLPSRRPCPRMHPCRRPNPSGRPRRCRWPDHSHDRRRLRRPEARMRSTTNGPGSARAAQARHSSGTSMPDTAARVRIHRRPRARARPGASLPKGLPNSRRSPRAERGPLRQPRALVRDDRCAEPRS